MTESWVPEDRLNELLIYVKNHHWQRWFEDVGAPPPVTNIPFWHIKYASQAFLRGALPDAKTLAFIAYAFDKYIRSEGAISLDEAFGLKSKPHVGNPAAQWAKENDANGKLFDMACLKAEDPSLSIEKAAAEICKDDPELKEAATLKRKYTKDWKKIEEILKGK